MTAREPSDWQWGTLDSLVQFRSGGTPDKRDSTFWGGNIPWITAKDLKSFELTDSIDHVTTLGAGKVRGVDAGAILILVRGMALHKDIPIGLTTRFLTFNQDVKALIPSTRLVPKFLLYYLLSKKQELLSNVESAGHGTGRLNTDLLQSLRVPIPPLSEQRRIADILATWDQAIVESTKRISLAQQLFSSMIARFAWPEHGRNHHVKLNSLLSIKRERVGSRTGLTVYSVTRDGLIPQSEHFNKRVSNEDISRHMYVERDDFVLSGLNFWLGSVDVSLEISPICISPDYKVFRLSGNLDALYFRYVIRTHAFRAMLKEAAVERASVVRKNFDRETFLENEIPLPPLSEQRRVATAIRVAEQLVEISHGYARALPT